VSLGAGPALADVVVVALDAWGTNVDMNRSNASIERTPPERDVASPMSLSIDPDAIRFVLGGRPGELPSGVSIVASDAAGAHVDQLEVWSSSRPCPAGLGRYACATPLIRAMTGHRPHTHS
jgi:hypothetical protein